MLLQSASPHGDKINSPTQKAPKTQTCHALSKPKLGGFPEGGFDSSSKLLAPASRGFLSLAVKPASVKPRLAQCVSRLFTDCWGGRSAALSQGPLPSRATTRRSQGSRNTPRPKLCAHFREEEEEEKNIYHLQLGQIRVAFKGLQDATHIGGGDAFSHWWGNAFVGSSFFANRRPNSLSSPSSSSCGPFPSFVLPDKMHPRGAAALCCVLSLKRSRWC